MIFAEAGWVSRDMGAVRRAAALRYGALAVIGLVAAALLGAWGLSFVNNKALIAATDSAVEQYRVKRQGRAAGATTSPTSNSPTRPALLQLLRNMPVGYDNGTCRRPSPRPSASASATASSRRPRPPIAARWSACSARG